MSEPIKEGDLVQVVLPSRCGCNRTLGHVFIVGAIRQSPGGGFCNYCGTDTFPSGALAAEWPGTDAFVELRRLKRIPPMSQLEHYRTEELLRRDVKDPA